MSYIQENLMSGEEVIHRAYIHRITYVIPLCFMLLFLPMMLGLHMEDTIMTSDAMGGYIGLVFFGIPCIVFLKRWINRMCSEFVVTNKRVLYKTGLFSLNTDEIQLVHVEGLSVKQGLIGKIVNEGTVIVSGSGGRRSSFKQVANPVEFRNCIHSASGQQ